MNQVVVLALLGLLVTACSTGSENTAVTTSGAPSGSPQDSAARHDTGAATDSLADRSARAGKFPRTPVKRRF